MTMIERIARAMAKADGQTDSHHLEDYIITATAALRELLQPTEGMLLAANTAYSFDGCFHEAINETLRAAIQAALEGE